MRRTAKAAKLLGRLEAGDEIAGKELRPIFDSVQIWDFYTERYPELGRYAGQQLSTALLFVAAGVGPEEFL
jgi:hypothetical protein